MTGLSLPSHPDEATFTQVLESSYRECPQAACIYLLQNRQPDLTITYRDLLHGAAGYAAALEESGIQPGEVVILLLQHSLDLIYAFFGAVLHGAIPSVMPFLTEKLSPEHYRRSLSALFEITQPAAAITYPDFVQEVIAVQSDLGSASPLRALLVSEDVQPAPNLDFNRLAGNSRSAQDIVLLQHSSGTTGLQKGVALSHQAVFNQIQAYSQTLRLKSQDVIVSWLPLYHDMGLIAGFLLPVLTHVPLVLLSPFDWVRAPYRLFQAISTYRGTLTWLPNFAYNFCAQKIRDRDLEGVDLSSWRAVINCSEPMHWKSHQTFLERFQVYGLSPLALATCYAMAENVFAVTQGGLEGPVREDLIDAPGLLEEQVARPAQDLASSVRLLSAGKPLPNVHLRVLDSSGQDLPERWIGEIALQSDCMLSGYYHRPDVTKQAFLDGWYLTGDLGYLADGELYITGRKKDLIIVGGKNVYPQDIERLVNEVEGVHPGRVVAFGVFNEDSGTEDVVVVAEAEFEPQGEPQATAALANEIRRRVTTGSDVALRYVQIVPRNWLIKTSSGKIARGANKERYLTSIQDKKA